MPSWANEVQAYMDASVMIGAQWPLDFQFLLQISFKLSVNVVHNGFEAIFFVNLISISNRIHNRQLPKMRVY